MLMISYRSQTDAPDKRQAPQTKSTDKRGIRGGRCAMDKGDACDGQRGSVGTDFNHDLLTMTRIFLAPKFTLRLTLSFEPKIWVNLKRDIFEGRKGHFLRFTHSFCSAISHRRKVQFRFRKWHFLHLCPR